MKRNISIVAFLCCVFTGFAQDTTIKTKDLLSLRWGRYRLNGEKITKKDARAELMKFPSSSELYKKSKIWTTIGIVTTCAGALIVLITPKKDPFLPNKNKGLRVTGWTLTGGGLVTSLIGIQQRQKAIKQYNRHVTIY